MPPTPQHGHWNWGLIGCALLLSGVIVAQDLPAPPPAREAPFFEPFEVGGAVFPGEEEPDEIETDRDSFTPATTTTGFRRLTTELAWSFIDNRTVADTHSLPEWLARYGINDWLELRLGWNYEVGGAANSISGGIADLEIEETAELERESQLTYGLKAVVTRQDGWRPESAVVLQGGTPTSGVEPATQFFATYVAGWQFPNRWKWDSAIRYGYDSAEGDHFNVWAPSTVLKIPVSERWMVHAEYFGGTSQGRALDRQQHYFSPGAHYLITSDLEVGFRCGWGLNDAAANFFVNVGTGWRY